MLAVEKVSNGVKGWNSKIINIAYIGGIDANGKPTDNRTEAQKKSLVSLLKLLRKTYPNAIIRGHRDFSPDLNHDGKITPMSGSRLALASMPRMSTKTSKNKTK